MSYIQKILDETITLAELYSDACKQELKNVVITVKKVMKQISKIDLALFHSTSVALTHQFVFFY